MGINLVLTLMAILWQYGTWGFHVFYVSFLPKKIIETKPVDGGISMLKKFIKNESGATAIEYGLIAAAIAVAIAAVLFTFGGELTALFEGLSGQISGAPA